jgi:nucleoside diphosphate kinase
MEQIIAKIENSKELTIKNMFQRELLKEEVINLFYKHENKPYFEDLLRYMMSGESCVMVLVNANETEGDPIVKWKKMIGNMNPE